MHESAHASQLHVFMYFYYFLAALGPAYKKWTWWKVYMTKMQLACPVPNACVSDTPQAQFYIVLAHIFNVIYMVHVGSCDFPAWMGYGWLLYCLSMIVLFTSFYVRAYVKGERLAGAKRGQPILAPPLGQKST